MAVGELEVAVAEAGGVNVLEGVAVLWLMVAVFCVVGVVVFAENGSVGCGYGTPLVSAWIGIVAIG